MTLRLPASTPRATRSAAAEVAGEDRAGQAVLGVVGQRDRVAPRRRTASPRRPARRPPRARSAPPGRRRSPPTAAPRSRRRRASSRRRRPRPRRGSRCTVACCCAEISGPISLDSSAGSSTRMPATAGSSRDEELVVRRPLDQDPRARAAVLAGVVEDGVRRAGGRRGDVGVGEDDVGALAAELEGHPLHLVGAAAP